MSRAVAAIAALALLLGACKRPAPTEPELPDAGPLADLVIEAPSMPVGPCAELPLLSAWQSPRPTDVSLWSRGAVALQAKCGANDAKACHELGRIVRSGEGAPLDLPRAELLFRAACARGEIEACVDGARLVKRLPEGIPQGVDPDAMMAHACAAGSKRGCAWWVNATHSPFETGLKLHHLCRDGDTDACAVLIELAETNSRYEVWGKAGVPQMFEAYTKALSAQCERGLLDACMTHADRLACRTTWFARYKGCDVGMVEKVQAEGIADRVCKAGDPRGCAFRAWTHRTGGHAPEAEAIEKELLRKCNGGELAACTALATYDPPHRWNGDVTPLMTQVQRALCMNSSVRTCAESGSGTSERRACILGDESACRAIVSEAKSGGATLDGGVENPSLRRALQIMCSIGDDGACMSLRGAAPACATELLVRSCRLRSGMVPCVDAARALEAKNDPRSWHMRELACRDLVPSFRYRSDEEKKEAVARIAICREVAKHYDDEKDETRAAEIWALACLELDGPSCATFAERVRLGRGVPSDAHRASVMYLDACNNGEKSACSRALKL